MVYQRCSQNGNASCTCAIAVKFGDDVFVVEKCRKIQDESEIPDMKIVLYVNGNLTQGTRVFIKKLGAEYEVCTLRFKLIVHLLICA